MTSTVKNCTKVFFVTLATVVLVIIISVLCIRVFFQQQEINNFKRKLENIRRNGRITENHESAHLVGCGNKVIMSRPADVLYRVTSWKIQHMSGNMTYDDDGHLTVKIDGVYFVYSQMYYHNCSYSYTGFNVYIDNKIILKAYQELPITRSVVANYYPKKMYYTHYTGGSFKITKGQKIWVGNKITRPFYFNEYSSFFGAYMVHPLP